MFPPGKKSRDGAVDYDGPRDSSGIVHWALDKLGDWAPSPIISEVRVQMILFSSPVFLLIFLSTYFLNAAFFLKFSGVSGNLPKHSLHIRREVRKFVELI